MNGMQKSIVRYDSHSHVLLEAAMTIAHENSTKKANEKKAFVHLMYKRYQVKKGMHPEPCYQISWDNVNKPDCLSCTPVHYYVMGICTNHHHYNEGVVDVAWDDAIRRAMLIADVTIRNIQKKTAADVAAEYGYYNLAGILQDDAQFWNKIIQEKSIRTSQKVLWQIARSRNFARQFNDYFKKKGKDNKA